MLVLESKSFDFTNFKTIITYCWWSFEVIIEIDKTILIAFMQFEYGTNRCWRKEMQKEVC